MTPLITLMHPNEISGCTIMTDGTKLYWSEGHSLAMIVTPDGTMSHVHAEKVAGLDMAPVARDMTAAEVAEYEVAGDTPVT